MVSTTEHEAGKTESLRCMKIWGGNEPVDDAISVPGIDAFVRCRPHHGAQHGGDTYFVSVCGSGDISRFLLADVSGHGVGVDEFSQALRRLMRKNINRANPSRLAGRLNEEFSRVSTGGVFATALVMTYFAPTDHLIVTNAGHPSPLWFDESEGRWSLLKGDDPRVRGTGDGSGVGVRNLPLGIIGDGSYEQFAVPLGPGDIVIAYTDALVEARDASGEDLGEQGLLDLVRGLGEIEASSLGGAIDHAVVGVRVAREADDDQTILVLSHNAGSPPKLSLPDKLRVMGRMLGLGES